MAGRATRTESSQAAHVALLRGINVGGNHMLPMTDLARMFTKAGCADVRTYIQSGNVVFVPPAGASLAKKVPLAVAEQIEKRFGFRPTIILRSGDELAAIVKANPFLTSETDLKTLHVGFFESAPDAQRIARLDPSRSPGDRFVVRGREIFLHFPNGMGRTKLTNAYIDSMLATTSTFRNWRTVMKLAAMANDARRP